MAPVHYYRHIGLEVPTGLVSKAFYETSGLGEDFSKDRTRRVNVGTYRFAVRAFLPRIASRKKPGIGTYSLAGRLCILPRLGPIKLTAIKGATPATEQLYAVAVLASADALRATLARFTPPSALPAEIRAQIAYAALRKDLTLPTRSPSHLLKSTATTPCRTLTSTPASPPTPALTS